jgi:spermidine synthase
MNKTKTEQKAFPPSIVPGTTIFLASVCVMMVEIVAGRLAARYIGSSLYTWTAVIGVILGGITFGYYIGGRLADSFSARKTIGWLLAASSGACVAAIILNNLVGEWTFLWYLEMAQRVLCHIAIVFFIPSTLIGAISPIAIKMALESKQHSGRTIGRMYALGAAGSILGTFLAGFWLIGAIGSVNTLWVTAGILLVIALMYPSRSATMYVYAIIIIFMAATGIMPVKLAEDIGSSISLRQIRKPELLYETESQYCYIAVRQINKQPDERLFTEDNMESHSRIIMDRVKDLRLFYAQVYAAVTQQAANRKEKLCTLTIGGGGYVFPRFILEVWPGSQVDVVEIDPAVTKAAIQAFGLPMNTPIRTINLDGRNYVDELLERKRRGEQIPQYDFVYMDAFSNMLVPFQLVTQQFNEKIREIMAADGVYLINAVDIFNSGKFAGNLVNTLERTFPHVYLVKKRSRNDLPENNVIIASKKAIDLSNIKTVETMADNSLWVFDDNDIAELKKKADAIILSDNYAPVENLLAPAVRQTSASIMAEKYIKQAEELNSAGRWEMAVNKYRMAIRICPAFSARVSFLISRILADHGKLAEAADALRLALAENDPQASKSSLATLHYNLGIILNKIGDTKGAVKAFNDAIKLLQTELAEKGDSSQTYSRLGTAYSAIGDTKNANLCYEKAKQLQEDKPK